MPTRSSRVDALVDTSVAVALVVADHEHHRATSHAAGRRVLGLAGHAAYETLSVLTRLPGPARRTPDVIVELLQANFPGSRFVSPSYAAALLPRLAAAGIAGGAVYDALVGAAAAEHRLPLLTRDRRAVDTYRALDVEVELVA